MKEYVNKVDLDAGPKGLAVVDVRMHLSPADARALAALMITKTPSIRVLVPGMPNESEGES